MNNITIENIASLVPESMLSKSGAVFYSGRNAFTGSRPLYILGLNPGGNPADPEHETTEQTINRVLERESDNYSAYRDNSWAGLAAGKAKLQRRILHLMRNLDLDPGEVPASNLVFLRSARKATFEGDFREAMKACWPFHETVINALQVRAVLCMGGDVARHVRDHFNATTVAGRFVEQNNRKWTSTCYRSADGLAVLQVSHPAIADWTCPATDPSCLVAEALIE